MYKVFNKSKTSLHACWSCPVKALLEKYSGREAILYAKVCKASKMPNPLDVSADSLAGPARPTTWTPVSSIQILRHGNRAAGLFGTGSCFFLEG